MGIYINEVRAHITILVDPMKYLQQFKLKLTNERARTHSWSQVSLTSEQVAFHIENYYFSLILFVFSFRFISIHYILFCPDMMERRKKTTSIAQEYVAQDFYGWNA